MIDDSVRITKQHTQVTLDAVRQAVNEYLACYLVGKQQAAAAISPQYGRLWQAITDLNQAGGKRFRPYMVMLAYSSFGGIDAKNLLPVAAAWELLHLCLLVHDDIIDNDLVRYGVKNIAGQYKDIYDLPEIEDDRRAHLAASAALLAGDLLLSAAHELVLDSDLSAEQKIAAQRYIVGATYAVAGGELLDTEAVLYSVDAADTFAIAKYKSAIYTFVGPLCCGAVLAGASDETLASLEKLGVNLGYAFQLADDLLGVFGDTRATGKSVLGDLNEGKRTFLLQKTLELCDQSEADFVHSKIGSGHVSKADATAIKAIMKRSGAKAATEAAIAEYADQSRKIVANLGVTDGYRQSLLDLITAVTVRSS